MAEFHGQGVLNTGQLSAGRDFNIGVASRDSDILLKIRSTDPRDDKTRIEQQKGGLLRDSYKWILSHEDFLKWRDGEGYQLLWVRGDPGKGKTMLLCGVIDELNKSRTDSWNIAYFFCQGTNHQLRKASFVLQGLIFSLLSQRLELLDCVRDDINQASGEMFRDLNGWAALCRIFGRLIYETERRRQTTYLMVDGLDECLEDRRQLIEWIAGLSSPSIRLLISSRNWPLIEDGLSGAKRKVPLHLELNDQSISAAVDCYIDHKVTDLEISKGLELGPREAVRRHLKSNSNNTFLWVALVCGDLGREDTRKWEMLNMLHEFPSGLDELYERMARHVFASKDANICRQVLSIQTLAYRPLTFAELSSIAGLTQGIAESSLQQIVGLCGSFLTVKNRTVYFVHQSAKEYLVNSMSSPLFPQGTLVAGHRIMVLQSIQALTRNLRENMYQLPFPGSHVDGSAVPNPDPLDGIRYACVYWADHLLDSKLITKRNVDGGDLLYRFIGNHLLHWFEALSLMKILGSGVKILANILSALQINTSKSADDGSPFLAIQSFKGSKEALWHRWATRVRSKCLQEGFSGDKIPGREGMQALQDLVYDAWRFLRHHKIGIEIAPLQVYSSALIFSPTHSLIRQTFLRKPEWLLMSPTKESRWDSVELQTLEGHTGSITCVTFAPNGKYLASGAVDDDTARIWDITTGECLKTLKHYEDGVDSIAFSPNGECLASSTHGTICIWSAVTGICLRKLTYPYPTCDSGIVTFLDDRNIISINGTTVYSWDTATGQRVCHRTLLRRFRPALALSQGGERAAWAWRQGKNVRIEVVDTIAGKYYKTPWSREVEMDDYGNVPPIAFNGKYMVIYSRSYPIQGFILWDLATDQCKRLPGMAVPRCLVLALSPSNEYIGAETSKGVCEYNIATGRLVEVEVNTGTSSFQRIYRSNLAYSSDSRLLILGGAPEVRILDMSAARAQHGKPELGHSNNERNSNSHSDSGTSRGLTMFPNGTLLGTGRNHRFQAWDLVKRKLVRSRTMTTAQNSETHLELNSDDDNYNISDIWNGLILSPDGTFLGIGACHDFQIWNLVKNKRIGAIAMSGGYCRLSGHEVQANFSPENKYLACRSSIEGEPVFELFDAATGRRLWMAPEMDTLEWVRLDGRICVALLSPSLCRLGIKDAATGKTLSNAYVRTGPRRVSALSCDGKMLAYLSSDQLYIFDIAAQALKIIASTWTREYYHNMILAGSSLRFSSDNRYVIISDSDGLVHLTDATTGTVLKVFEGFGKVLPSVTGLHTERGVCDIEYTLLHHPREYICYKDIFAPKDNLSGLGISPDRDWILRNGEPYLWLPIQLRCPFWSSRIAIAGNTIVFGDGAGEVYCIRLDSLSQARL